MPENGERIGASLFGYHGLARVTRLIEEVIQDKSSQPAGQVFEPDRPHESLHVLGRRPKTKTLVTVLKAVRASDMPSKPVCGRELAGGFDSRPPPLRLTCRNARGKGRV